jgi:Hypothetical protein (DUF2513)
MGGVAKMQEYSLDLALDHKDSDVKRDMDLVRELMLKIEDDPQLDGRRFKELSVDGRAQEEVVYVLTLLVKYGFATGNTGMEDVLVSGLTWEGHELLDNIRDPGVWEKTKEKAKPLLSVSLAILAELAKSEVKRRLGLS